MLLLLIAVFGGVYVWITKFQKKAQEQVDEGAGSAISKTTGSVKYMFSVLSVQNDGSSNVQIVLKNDGNVEVRDSDLNNLIVKVDGKVYPIAGIVQANAANTNWEPNEMITLTLSGITWTQIDDGNQHTFYFELGNLGSSTNFNCGPLDPNVDVC